MSVNCVKAVARIAAVSTNFIVCKYNVYNWFTWQNKEQMVWFMLMRFWFDVLRKWHWRDHQEAWKLD